MHRVHVNNMAQTCKIHFKHLNWFSLRKALIPLVKTSIITRLSKTKAANSNISFYFMCYWSRHPTRVEINSFVVNKTYFFLVISKKIFHDYCTSCKKRLKGTNLWQDITFLTVSRRGHRDWIESVNLTTLKIHVRKHNSALMIHKYVEKKESKQAVFFSVYSHSVCHSLLISNISICCLFFLRKLKIDLRLSSSSFKCEFIKLALTFLFLSFLLTNSSRQDMRKTDKKFLFLNNDWKHFRFYTKRRAYWRTKTC